MTEKVCIICSKKFLRKKSQILLSGGKYCSNKCRFVGRKNGKNIICSVCGCEVYRSSKELKRSKSGKYFCSNNCLLRWLYKKYAGQSNWKGGFFTEYRKKLVRNSIGKQTDCLLCKENNLKMLVAHHVDKDRLNNSVSNLRWLCHNCHFLVHHYKKEEKELYQKLHDKKV